MFLSVEALEGQLTTPSPALVTDLAERAGDLVILGAGGKMGPTLAVLARRAMDQAGRTDDRVVAVSRWSDRHAAIALQEQGVHTVSIDLLAEDSTTMPDGTDVIFMAGAKFGTSSAPHLAWAVNAALPDRVARRYRDSRIAVLSTGNVYPFMAIDGPGSAETDPTDPVGEYAMSCLGRERVFEYAAASRHTPVSIIRLNYAVDLRYGVLMDIAARILAGTPIDVTTSVFNVVWQGYANEVVLRSLGHASTDPFVLNVTGPETVQVRQVAMDMAARLDRPVSFTGRPAGDALTADASKCHRMFGYPPVSASTLAQWQAEWMAAGMPTSSKPTKFDVRDGRY